MNPTLLLATTKSTNSLLNELAAKKSFKADKGTTVVPQTCIFQTNRNSSKKIILSALCSTNTQICLSWQSSVFLRKHHQRPFREISLIQTYTISITPPCLSWQASEEGVDLLSRMLTRTTFTANSTITLLPLRQHHHKRDRIPPTTPAVGCFLLLSN